MPLSSCDEDRLRLAQEVEKQLEHARELAGTDDHAGALECYLFAFDNSLAVHGWGGVRLSYIPSEIADLGVKYPPALTALKLRRDAREELIRHGERDFNVLLEWLSLNRYLKEQERELALSKELEGKGVLDDTLKDMIITSNFERLLTERRYDVLSPYFDGFGNKFLHTIFHRERQRLFPKRGPQLGESLSEYWKGHIREEGAKLFELALGSKKQLQADEITKRILIQVCDVETYNRLIEAALRAGQKNKARALVKQAKATLPSTEHERVRSIG